MTLCFEPQQSREMDYESGTNFAMKFIQGIWQIRTLHGNRVTWNAIKNQIDAVDTR